MLIRDRSIPFVRHTLVSNTWVCSRCGANLHQTTDPCSFEVLYTAEHGYVYGELPSFAKVVECPNLAK
jgi:hypothetical protein